MAKTTLSSVILEIAQNYVSATKDTEDITYGNVVGKVTDAMNAGGPLISSVTLNSDGSYSIMDDDDVVHSLVVEEEDGQIVGVEYDGDSIRLEFESGFLVGVGDTSIDVSEYPEPPKVGKGTIPFSNIFECITSDMEVTKNA